MECEAAKFCLFAGDASVITDLLEVLLLSHSLCECRTADSERVCHATQTLTAMGANRSLVKAVIMLAVKD